MGWTVLYIAFGVVALWLLGEVLLQYKARLRWRLLAFTGFVGVVAGALIPSIVVIGVGIGAFATGQVFVTLSYRRGFSTGWALGGRPGSSRRRRGGAGAPKTDPALQVSGVEAGHDTDSGYSQPAAGSGGLDANTFELQGFGTAGPAEAEENGFGTGVYQDMQEATAVYRPGPLPEDTEQHDDGYLPYGGQGPFGIQDGYGGQPGYGTGHGQDDYGAAGPSYGFDSPQDYAPYSDPYIAYDGNGQYQPASYGFYDAYGSYDTYGSWDVNGNASGYEPQGHPYGQHPYAPGDGMYGSGGYGGQFGYPGDYAPQEPYYSDTPPGGVFFPQQRDPDSPPPVQPQTPVQHGPYDNGYYYDEQRGY